jgi:hypothetical protein
MAAFEIFFLHLQLECRESMSSFVCVGTLCLLIAGLYSNLF